MDNQNTPNTTNQSQSDNHEDLNKLIDKALETARQEVQNDSSKQEVVEHLEDAQEALSQSK